MAHYIIAQIDIQDREKYAQYEAGFMDVFTSYKGKLLSVDENVSLLEGQWPATRTVLIEFPSKEEALAWYESEEYQSLAKHRFAASSADIVIVSGIE
ncbi:uncharacterized protein METZ01_LOCUS165731 [marine metagenome]|uniref:DUF1330 domain-containing protein n=1 Tax=marine metagenome TaxID=408172 RepID=A0A382BI46_9ZZZZ|tara:strand:- start:284 stop:574 length:291 start_codon:yes stop_codon:yes gene_type:complete